MFAKYLRVLILGLPMLLQGCTSGVNCAAVLMESGVDVDFSQADLPVGSELVLRVCVNDVCQARSRQGPEDNHWFVVSDLKTGVESNSVSVKIEDAAGAVFYAESKVFADQVTQGNPECGQTFAIAVVEAVGHTELRQPPVATSTATS